MKNVLVEILVEESSMMNFLQVILPKILPEGYILNENCFIRHHQGKQDLRRSIPKKVKAYQYYSKPVKVIIIHDQDSADCKELKSEIQNLVNSNSSIPSLVRIACRELESWYLGDMNALESVYPQFRASKYRYWAKFRNPDLCQAYYEIKRIIPIFQKSAASKLIPKYINIDGNTSKSFNLLIDGVKRFLN